MFKKKNCPEFATGPETIVHSPSRQSFAGILQPLNFVEF
jgi:hypothetical protein